jgi:hypothetical protein
MVETKAAAQEYLNTQNNPSPKQKKRKMFKLRTRENISYF